MAEKKLPLPKIPENPAELLEEPLKVIEDFDLTVQRIDKALKSFDNLFASADSRLLSRPPEPIGRAEHVFSPSYPGQSPESSCLECLVRHYFKALGLLEEAERFSLGKGEITPEARRRVEAALKEIVTAEEDLGTEIRDAELAKMIDGIKARQREFRKWTWTERLLTTQRDISKLKEAISRMKDIVETTRRAAEYYDSKYGRCSYCETLAREISSRFGLEEAEILDSIYGLASDSKERVSESAEKLKRLGVFEYTMQRVKEMLTELREK
ncbi:MAG: hypothetical protein FGF53_08010 [Candidatus Brockarchaeota archaeon]|nr:hypothetical protein [Candidatus Brockarchaeota archaeon]